MEEGAVTGVWKLSMTEVWKADKNDIWVRMDGAWSPRPIGIAFQVPEDHWENRQSRRHWRIPERPLACGRVPALTMMAGNRTISDPVTKILHLGWACEADRDGRYQRYAKHDDGQFHQKNHLDSIMWSDEKVTIYPEPWPEGLDREKLLERINR